jgi:hypothetical protein
MIVFQYRVDRTLKLSDLNEMLDRVWLELSKDDGLRRQLTTRGVPLDALRSVDRNQTIQVERHGAGADPLTTTIAITFLPVAAKLTEKILLDLWDNIILPRIKTKLGEGAIGLKIPNI